MYNVTGTKALVKKVSLALNVNDKSEVKQAHAELAKLSEKLAAKATGAPLPKDVNQAIAGAKNGEWKSDGFAFKLEKIDFSGTLNGYQLLLSIE